MKTFNEMHPLSLEEDHWFFEALVIELWIDNPLAATEWA